MKLGGGLRNKGAVVPRTLEDDEEEEKNLDARMRRTGPIVIDENEPERPMTGKSKATNFGRNSVQQNDDDDLFGGLTDLKGADNVGGKYVE